MHIKTEFNSIPQYLRNNCEAGPKEWKCLLDEFLSNIPDLPITADLTPGLCVPLTAKATNSIIHWIPFLGLTNRRGKGDKTHNFYSTESDIEAEQLSIDMAVLEAEQVRNIDNTIN